MRKFLSASVVVLSLTGLTGVAAAAGLEVAPYGMEARASGQHQAGQSFFESAVGAPTFVNREATEGLQAEAREPFVRTLRYALDDIRPLTQRNQQAANSGR